MIRYYRVILVFFVTLFFCSLVFADSRIGLSQGSFQLGKITEGKIYEYSFFIQNLVTKDLTFKSPKATCGCIKILEPTESFILRPGQKAIVRFTYDSTGLKGKAITKYIFIETDELFPQRVTIPIDAEVISQPEAILKRFKSFNPAMVIGAGLVDGINPCAFTVLVFFISFLSFVGYKKNQLFFSGSLFILAVFLTYLLIGLGIFEFFRQLKIFYFFTKIVYFLTAAFAFCLGTVSLYDALIYRKTKDPERIKLRLPQALKTQIQGIIRDKTDIRDSEFKTLDLKLILGVLSCGFIVSLLESVCTGQLYLPTIIYVLKASLLKAEALGYLLLYNLMFILPLILIFFAALIGFSSSDFARFAKRHIVKIKVLTALVFFCLGAMLFIIR